MLISVYQQGCSPDSIDKSLETGENYRSRKKFEDEHMLTSILNS